MLIMSASTSICGASSTHMNTIEAMLWPACRQVNKTWLKPMLYITPHQLSKRKANVSPVTSVENVLQLHCTAHLFNKTLHKLYANYREHQPAGFFKEGTVVKISKILLESTNPLQDEYPALS